MKRFRNSKDYNEITTFIINSYVNNYQIELIMTHVLVMFCSTNTEFPVINMELFYDYIFCNKKNISNQIVPYLYENLLNVISMKECENVYFHVCNA